jgi:DNA repair exonuclease SbcCD ATPase subunit
MRYRQYGEDDPIHFDVVEHSLTPTPACKECVALDILNESDKMTELEEKLKEIEELEKQLTQKDKLLEDLEGKIVVIEKQLEDIEKESKVKDEELEQEKTDKDKITEQILEFKDKLNEQTKIIDELKEKNAMKDIEPLINNLIELDGKEMEELYRMKAQNAYKEGDKAFEEAKEFLRERAKNRESAVHAVTTDLDETALKAQQVIDEELEDPTLAKKRDERAFANMGKEFYEWRKNRGA